MQKLQLYIDSNPDGTTTYQEIDLFKDETVSMTRTIQNVKDISKIFTEFTKTFSVPASKTNNKLFKHYYNFDISGTFDARKKRIAKIELNSVPFQEGYIKLEGAQLKKNKPTPKPNVPIQVPRPNQQQQTELHFFNLLDKYEIYKRNQIKNKQVAHPNRSNIPNKPKVPVKHYNSQNLYYNNRNRKLRRRF